MFSQVVNPSPLYLEYRCYISSFETERFARSEPLSFDTPTTRSLEVAETHRLAFAPKTQLGWAGTWQVCFSSSHSLMVAQVTPSPE